MVFNCYFANQPSMFDWAPISIFDRVVHRLRLKYPEHSFELIDSVKHSTELNISHIDNRGRKFGYGTLLIENPKNKNYLLISFLDRVKDIKQENGWDINNLSEIYTSCGMHTNPVYYPKLDQHYTPISYPVQTLTNQRLISLSDTSFDKKVILDKPFFRGSTYGFREYLQNDSRFTIVSTNRANLLNSNKFINELNSKAVSLCLDGIGEITHRDIESFGLGAVVLRRKLTVEFSDKLIPDYHYLAVQVDDLHNLPPHKYFKELADRFIDKYSQASKDVDFLRFLSYNGQQWYYRNGTVDAIVEVILSKIDLQTLLNTFQTRRYPWNTI